MGDRLKITDGESASGSVQLTTVSYSAGAVGEFPFSVPAVATLETLDLDAAEKAANAAAKARPEYAEYEAALRELRVARGDPRGEATGTTRPEKDERHGRR